jgi:hypothetical protein
MSRAHLALATLARWRDEIELAARTSHLCLIGDPGLAMADNAHLCPCFVGNVAAELATLRAVEQWRLWSLGDQRRCHWLSAHWGINVFDGVHCSGGAFGGVVEDKVGVIVTIVIRAEA